jgi:hypothetical protein
MNKQTVELTVALAVGALCAGGLVESWGYSGQSSYMPIAVLAFAACMSLIWAAQSALGLVRGSTERMDVEGPVLARFAFLVVAIVAYVLGVTWLGFFTSTLIMVPVVAAVLGYRHWAVSLTATLAFVAVLYGVFRLLLSIPLPEEAVLGLLGS